MWWIVGAFNKKIFREKFNVKKSRDKGVARKFVLAFIEDMSYNRDVETFVVGDLIYFTGSELEPFVRITYF
tara:strand:- start:2744 stop:2956 length:213 start_codon:yes stop_codon:yes gene_type:complete